MTRSKRKPVRILLADDDADVREAMRDFLLCEGFQILEADSGLAALEILLKEHGRMTFSIMDVDMPGMTGFEVLRQVRSLNLSLPCIFITGDDSRQRQAEALEVGAFSLLTKPVALDVLRFSMRRLLDHHFRGCR